MLKLIDPKSFLAAKDVVFRVNLADGPIDIAGKWLAINAVLWQPLLKRNLPITAARHLFHKEKLNTDVRRRINLAIYDDVVAALGAKEASTVKTELFVISGELYDLIAEISSPDMLLMGETSNRDVASMTMMDSIDDSVLLSESAAAKLNMPEGVTVTVEHRTEERNAQDRPVEFYNAPVTESRYSGHKQPWPAPELGDPIAAEHVLYAGKAYDLGTYDFVGDDRRDQQEENSDQPAPKVD